MSHAPVLKLGEYPIDRGPDRSLLTYKGGGECRLLLSPDCLKCGSNPKALHTCCAIVRVGRTLYSGIPPRKKVELHINDILTKL